MRRWERAAGDVNVNSPEWDLLEKTELSIEHVEIDHADLTSVALCREGAQTR